MVATSNHAELSNPVSLGGGGYLPINPEDGFLLDRFFPDIQREPDPLPSRVNQHELRCRAALEVWLKAWYRPKVTYWEKHERIRGFTRNRFIWRE